MTIQTQPGPVGAAMIQLITLQVDGLHAEAEAARDHLTGLVQTAVCDLARTQHIAHEEAYTLIMRNVLDQAIRYSRSALVKLQARQMKRRLSTGPAQPKGRQRQETSRAMAADGPIGRATDHSRPLSQVTRLRIVGLYTRRLGQLAAGQHDDRLSLERKASRALETELRKRAKHMRASGMDEQQVLERIAQLRTSTMQWVAETIYASDPATGEQADQLLDFAGQRETVAV